MIYLKTIHYTIKHLTRYTNQDSREPWLDILGIYLVHDALGIFHHWQSHQHLQHSLLPCYIYPKKRQRHWHKITAEHWGCLNFHWLRSGFTFSFWLGAIAHIINIKINVYFIYMCLQLVYHHNLNCISFHSTLNSNFIRQLARLSLSSVSLLLLMTANNVNVICKN